ncbi:fibrous sheath-interacting protein 2 [Rhynchocyon petersi]
MELYLSACSKAATAAATKTAASSLTAESQHCGDGAQKAPLPVVGAAQLLDLPLGVKLPVIPGSNTVFYTTTLSEKLFQPSYDFNLTDPYCRLLENHYKSLHDPHLRAYYRRKDILRRLKKGGYITSNNKIVCSLREWNKYRQYLTSLKLDFERNYLKEQKMLAKRVNKLQENNHIPEYFDAAQFRNWLLQGGAQATKDQDQLIRHRYMDMINRELELIERTTERQHMLQKDQEERQQREYARRKLNLRRKIEEEWKEKEMLLLTKIGEDVKREARIEEQRRKNREESDRKKQALIEKKMAYHLQRLQEIGNKKEEKGKNTTEDKGPDRIPERSSANNIQNHLLNTLKKPATSDFSQANVQENSTGKKVTTEELNSIFQNIMTWVVATVTSILYPAITKYEERLRNRPYAASDDSVLSSESSSFCSTCSEEFTCESYTSATTKTFQTEPYTLTSEMPGRQSTMPFKRPTTQQETMHLEKTYHTKRPSLAPELKYNKARTIYVYPKIRSCKSDSHLLTSSETSTKISKDATTETDSLGILPSSGQNSKPLNELKNLKNVFVNFKCHLKGETELILKSIFQEIMSDLAQAIPSLSSVTAEVFVDQCEADKRDLLPYVDISSAAAEIVENMLDKLQSVVEKKCVEMFSPEDWPAHIKSDPTPNRECVDSSNEIPFDSSLYPLEPMCDIAEDMVHAILEKLMALATCRQNELPHLEDTTKPSYQRYLTDPTYTCLQKAGKKKSYTELNTVNLTVKEEIKKLISSIISQPSLVGYIEEAVSIILGYVQAELNNERLVASEETVLILQLLDDIFSRSHQESGKTGVRKNKRSRLINPSNTDEKYRLTSTGLLNGHRSGRRFSPVNVPGMVLYSEDDNEEIDKIVKNVLDSSIKDEKAKLQEDFSHHSLTKKNNCFDYENTKPPTKPASRYKASCSDCGSSFNDKDLSKGKPDLNKDIFIFSQDQKHQLQKSSEKIVKSMLTEILKDMPRFPLGHSDGNNGREPSIPVSGKCETLSHHKEMYQMFSVSEIRTVAQELTDAVLNILLKASSHITNTTGDFVPSSIHQTSLDCSDTLPMAKKVPTTKPLKTWFESKKKMKPLSPLNIDPPKPSWLDTGEDCPESLHDINDKIINTVFKKLKLFVGPKLKEGFKPSLSKQSSLRSQLSAYTTKVVSVVLHAIQNELELNKKSLRLSETDAFTTLKSEENFTDIDKKLKLFVTDFSDNCITSPLETYICNILSGQNADHSNVPHSTDKTRPETSNRSYSVDRQNVLPSSQDKNHSRHSQAHKAAPPEFRKCLETPCILHSVFSGKNNKENAKLQVLDTIGELLYEMLCKLVGVHAHSHLVCDQKNTEKSNENQQIATDLLSNIQLISKAILESIIAKLCRFDTDSNSPSSELKTVSDCLDIDNLSFASLIEEMAKCTNVISNMLSRMIQKDKNERSSNMENNSDSVASKPGTIREKHPTKLKDTASDILNVVFEKLEGFANGNLETLGTLNDRNKKISKMDCKCETTSAFTETHEELLQSALYKHAEKLSNALLKAIQNELNVNSPDVRTGITSPPPEKQIITDVVDLLLEAVSSGMFNDIECEERGVERYRYRPTYGNHLPGGAEPDSFLEDAAHAEKELTEARSPLVENTKSEDLKQWALEKVFSKVEVKLKEPEKSPIMPIIKNLLNEIFQNALVEHLNMLPSPQSDLSILHNVDEPVTQTSGQLMDKTTGPLVSETDVTIVADDFIRIVFRKLYSAAVSERKAGKSQYKMITFSANVSFHEFTDEGTSSVTVLNRDPCTVQSVYNVDKQARINVVEDIVQAVLTNLEIFTTSKVKSLFCPQASFTIPLTSPLEKDKSALSTVSSTQDPCSDEKFFCFSMDHVKSIKTNSTCQLPLSKLNTYATDVARKILQGIKHELDKEIQSAFLTHNIVVSEQIASQVVSTMLDIVSSKGKCKNISCSRSINSTRQESIVEKLFNKTDYRKVLQIQIQDTIEHILCDIYEKTLDQNNLSFTISTLNCNTIGKYSEKHSEMCVDSAHNVIKKLSVPMSDVIMISKDAVDIVLHNLNSAFIPGINVNDSISSRLSLTFCDRLPKEECQQTVLMDSKSERKIESFPSAENLKPSHTSDQQIIGVEKEDNKKHASNTCEENANFITKTIFSRLESFATERVDSLITLAFQPKEKILTSPGLENCKQDDRVFTESSQVVSGVTSYNQEFTDSTVTSEKVVSTIHLSPTSLKEYADIIASAILKLIKNDLDLQVQRMCSYSNNTPLEDSIIVSEIVTSILKTLYDKRSEKEICFYSKQKANLFSQLTISDEIMLGRTKKENNTEVSPFSNDLLEEHQIPSETENQRTILEDIFLRNEEQSKEKMALISAVKEVLNMVYQRVMKVQGQLSPFNETPNFTSNSKLKASDLTQKNSLQSSVNSIATGIVEDVLEQMCSVVVKCLYKNNTREEVEAADSIDAVPMKSSYSKSTKQAGKGIAPSACVLPPVYPCTSRQYTSIKENPSGKFSPLLVGKDLIHMVLQKIKDFASLPLEDSSSTASCINDVKTRTHSYKVSPKGSPKTGLKTNLKARPKMTSLPKYKTKQQLGSSGAKTKNKAKLYSGETAPRFSRSKTSVVGLPHILSTGDAKSILEIKFPTSELKLYSKDIVSNILETIMNEFGKVRQNQGREDRKVLPSDQIVAASEMVSAVLQGLSLTTNYNVPCSNKFSHLHDLQPSQGNVGVGSLVKTHACFFLENVSSQLEQIFPKDGIFKKLFDNWQTESSDTDSEKYKLLMIAENVLTEISIKAKELEYSLSLLNLPPLETSESRLCSHFKGAASTRAEDSKAHINTFGREITEMLLEKLQLCLLTQLPTLVSKDTPASRQEDISTKSKYSPSKHLLGNAAISNTTLIDQISSGSSNRVVRDIVERILNMLESFVDLQFKHISKYEFSEIVKMPIESFYPVQQRLLSKKALPKVQPMKNFSDDSKSNTIISKENIENTFLQVHSFHSDLLTYSTNVVSDMLGVIKHKLDKELSQMDPTSVNLSNENMVARDIIETLIDQCADFSESLINKLPKEHVFQGGENIYIVDQVEVASNMNRPTSKLKGTSLENNPPQVSVPGSVFYSEEKVKTKYKMSSESPSNVRYVGETSQSTEQRERLDLETTRLYSRNKIRGLNSKKRNYGNFDQGIQGNSCVPEGSMLQKLFKKANESTEISLKQAMSFIKMGKAQSPRVFHYENHPVAEAAQMQTTVSPLKICLAAENIVNTVLTSYGFPNQSHTNERMETMKPFFISEQNPSPIISEKEKMEEKSLVGTWDEKISSTEKEEFKIPEASGNFPLLQKWKKWSPEVKKIEILNKVEVIAFADHELGPKEIHFVAKHVTATVVTHLKNSETGDSREEKLSTVSTLSRSKCELKQPLKSIHNDSPLNHFCEHLTELVIYHIFSNIFDGTKEDRDKIIALENADVAIQKLIVVHSQVFESRTIPTRELALKISEIIIRILSNSSIIKADTVQEITSIERKYIYYPRTTAAYLDDLFHDLLIGVIHILSKEIGINRSSKSTSRNSSYSKLGSQRVPICDNINAKERQVDPGVCELSTHQINQLIQKNKLNYLACKLDNLISSLKNHESKEIVNKVFNIVLDVFLPDEYNSGKLTRNFSPSSNNQEENSTCGSNLGLSPKSAFLLNVVCEKLIRTLLEKCTSMGYLDKNDALCDEVAKECQLLNVVQNVEDEDFDYCKAAVGCQPFQGDYMSEVLGNLAEIDQDLLSSDNLLTIISHSLVKSLMEKLSHGVQHASENPPFESKHRTMERQASFREGKNSEFTELQDQDSFRLVNYESKPLRESFDNSMTVRPKIQAPFCKQSSAQSNVSPFKKQGTKQMVSPASKNTLHRDGIKMGIYSATFLEDIISELFFNLSTSLWGKSENINKAWLNEINILFVNSVVNEFNNAQITVLRNAEERLYFSPVPKETVSDIVDLVYNDVLQHYRLNVTCGNMPTHGSTSVAGQITNGILLEILDYQLPSHLREKLLPNAYYPLSAEIILQKLQNSLRDFTSQRRFSTSYSTMLSHSFLEDVIRRLLFQLLSPSMESSSLGRKYLMSSDFNEMSTCIVNKVMSAISRHKIFFTMYDNQDLYTGKNLQKMVDSVYRNILQMSDSLVSIQKSIVSQSPIIADQIASFIIQEIIENHLQPFLCGENVPHPKIPLDEISKMVKHVLSDVTESQRFSKPSPLGVYPHAFVEEIVARLLSKIFIPKSNPGVDLEKMTQKIVNSINNHFNKAKINTVYDNRECSVDTDIVNKLVNSVYRNVLKQHELYPEVVKASEDSDIFVENITNLIVAAISDHLLHPLFSGDLSDTSYSISMAENIVQDILSNNINKFTQPTQSLSPYNTLLPYKFLEDMIRVLLGRIFPSTPSMLPNGEFPKGRSEVNFNEIASKLISDIRMKIAQHEIGFSKEEEEETKYVYTEGDVQHLVDAVFTNILQNSESQESIEQNITDSNDILIDRIAGFIIKNICQKHLQPFVDRNSFTPSSCTDSDHERMQLFYARVYSSSFLEDVVSGVLSKIFHSWLGVMQIKSVKNSEDELLELAEKLIPLITEEFSKAQVSIIENAEYQLNWPPVEREKVIKMINIIYSQVLQECEMDLMPTKDFLNDTQTLAARVTKIILAETSDFQIHPDFLAKLPFKLQSNLSADVLMKKVKCDISKSRFRRQPSRIYTTMLSHAHLEKIVTQLISQMSPLVSSMEDPGVTQSELGSTVMKLINEIMSIISKHAICIIKHGSEKQSMISEKDIQSMVDSIYVDLSCSDLYKSLTKDKKGLSNIPISKTASFILKEVFNHHLQSFLSGDKSLLSAAVDQTYKWKAKDSKEREFSLIANSVLFLEEVISELLCKIFYAFSHNVFVAENPDKAKTKIISVVTTLVKSIVLEFTTSEILFADNVDENLHFSEGYKEMVQDTVKLIYEKLLDEYQSLLHICRVIQSDPVCFGRKIYYLLLGEIYDYQVESLVSGELAYSSYSFPRTDNIIKNVLDTIIKDKHTWTSCITVLPRSLLEDIIYRLLHCIFPLTDPKRDKEVLSDYEFLDAASKLTDEIITEISEHEIRLATTEEENTESVQLEAIENLVDSVCNNILKKSEFQAEVQKGVLKKGGSFLSKIAGLIMKEIMAHHLQPFLHSEESSSSDSTDDDNASLLSTHSQGKTQPSLYSATFLEDVIVDLVRKFYSLPCTVADSKTKEIPKPDIINLAIEFANSLIKEFTKSEIKVLPNAEDVFSFPPIDKETVNKITDFVYDQFIVKCGSNDTQKEDRSSIIIKMISSLAQNAISAFKIQPLFSGDWSSIFFSFLNPDNITQRVQHLSEETSTQVNRCLKGHQLTVLEESYKHTPLATDQKKDIVKINRDVMSRKTSFSKEDKSLKKFGSYDPLLSAVTSNMKSSIINQTDVPSERKQNGKKMETGIQNYIKNVAEVTSQVSRMESNDSQEPDLSVTLVSKDIGKKSVSTPKDEDGKDVQACTQFSVIRKVTQHEKKGPVSDFEIEHEKKRIKERESSLQNDGKPFTASLVSRARDTGGLRDPLSLTVSDEEHECVQNVIDNVYENILDVSLEEPADDSKSKSPSDDKAQHVIPEVNKDYTKSISTKDLSSSVKTQIPAKLKEEPKGIGEEIKSELGKPDSTHYSTENKPGIFPANFMEDIVTEMINKLIFSSPPETQRDDSKNVTDDENQAELYDTAMKLIDSLLKEFSDAQIKVFRPGKGNQFFPPADNISAGPKVPSRQKEPTSDETSSRIKMIIVDKITPVHKMKEKCSSHEVPSLEKMASFDKTLVNKVVHSSVCNILKEHKSQDSICKNINTNREYLARRLTSGVINEIFQHQLNLIFGEEIPASACLPLQSQDVATKIQKAVHTANKECQTTSAYTIMLPRKFLENVISSLLSKIVSAVSNVKAETSANCLCADLHFLQKKLVSTIMAEISKGEDMAIQYVESLHPNEDGITQLVVQSIYNDLLPQFGSQEIMQNCATSGCRMLSEAIVDLVLREVSGNQLQKYFSGELTPRQCAEVDSVVENILRKVIQTPDVDQPQSSRANKLSYNIVEEIAVKFLSKLLSVFPKLNKGQTKPLETEIEKIISKILNSVQEFISKNQIKLVLGAEPHTVPSADHETIESIVDSLYTSILKHFGSPASIFKDLLGKSNVLSDIIGFLMVKEISNSDFQKPQKEEVKNSELVLEAVKVADKVVKILDELKFQKKPLSRKRILLDTALLEEALAMLLAKLVKLPGGSIKRGKKLTKLELHKIASQLTKSVTDQISDSNIDLVVAIEPGEPILDERSREIVSQVVDSVYSDILQRSETHENLYSDIKGANRIFPKMVASLMVNRISNTSLNKSSSSYVNVRAGDLSTDQIVQKAQEHAVNITSDSEKEELDQISVEGQSPIKIVPHIGKKPIHIDPTIISEHLAVISVKTQSLEKLKMDCLQNTGHNIAELRKASLSGKSHSSEIPGGERRRRDRRISLDTLGRLDIKPLEAVCRNSFQNIRKPDLTKVELLKDIQSKHDLITRLVAHDIDQTNLQDNITDEEHTSDEEEIVLGEVSAQTGFLGQNAETEVKEAMKPVESKVVSSKITSSTNSMKRFLSQSKCSQLTSSVNIPSIEASASQVTGSPNKEPVKRTVAELDMTTCLVPSTEASSFLDKTPQRVVSAKYMCYLINLQKL